MINGSVELVNEHQRVVTTQDELLLIDPLAGKLYPTRKMMVNLIWRFCTGTTRKRHPMFALLINMRFTGDAIFNEFV